MIRQIEYTVTTEKGKTSATRKWGGMQFEDNATEVVFDISALGIENALYRIDFNSAGAGYQPSGNLTADGGKIRRLFPKLVTQYGGEVQVTAVITELDESGNETGVCYSYPAIIYFTDVEKDADGSSTVEENISAAEASAFSAALRAEQAAREAAEAGQAAELAQEKTEEARFALEEGAEFVFLGGDSTGSAEVEQIIDDELSEESTNPVQNKVITEALSGFNKYADKVSGKAESSAVAAAKEYTDKATVEAVSTAKAYFDSKIIVSAEEPADAEEGTIWLMIGVG